MKKTTSLFLLAVLCAAMCLAVPVKKVYANNGTEITSTEYEGLDCGGGDPPGDPGPHKLTDPE